MAYFSALGSAGDIRPDILAQPGVRDVAVMLMSAPACDCGRPTIQTHILPPYNAPHLTVIKNAHM